MRLKLFLTCLFIISLFLRLYKLADRPLGFTWDEAALGYNAYSILETGRDEYNQILPLVFKSFGDYKPGLYVYFTVPSILTFHLTELATRLPSAVFGSLLVIIVYILTRRLFSPLPATAAGIVMALNPWHLYFSRGAWEANLYLFFISLATLLFLKRRYMISSLFFGFTLLTYQGAKMFIPLLIISLWLIYRSQLKSLLKPLLLLLLLSSPIILGLGSQSKRLKVYSIFSYTRKSDTITEILRQDNTSIKNFAYYLFHSELLDQSRGLLQRYLNHFSPRFLFFAGDWQNLRHSIAYYGYFHLPDMVVLVIGLIFLIKLSNPSAKLLITWMLLAPLPSALSRDLVSGVRSLPLVVPLVIIIGLGISRLWQKKILFIIYSIIGIFFFAYYIDLFYFHSPYFTAINLLYPYKPALQLVKQHLSEYKKVVFMDGLGQPYIFTLFYLQFDPSIYQKSSFLTEDPQGDVGHVDKFDKFEFRPVFWSADHNLSSTMIVGDQYQLPETDLAKSINLIRIGEISYPNGAPALKVVGLK